MSTPNATVWALTLLGSSMLLVIVYLSMAMLVLYTIGYAVIKFFRPIIKILQK